jgi:proton-dependent oligopeptide transporter, POT family
MSNPTAARMPRQIPYIIGNEGCERFSFYGMRNILTVFLAYTFFAYLPEAESKAAAKEVFHTFVIGVYFFPLLGGWISDRFFGKYNTVFWLSIVYCFGHLCLAIFENNRTGFYTGLGLIAVGSGGIKPLVSAFVGDQFDQSNKHLSKKVYDAFYWIINFGSFFASLVMPILLRDHGPAWAFGVPGILMLVATIVFWAGRKRYVIVPPAPPNPHSFLRVSRTALFTTVPEGGRPGLLLAGLGALVVLSGPALFFLTGLGFVEVFCLALVAILAFGGAGTWIQLERARGAHPDEAVDGVRAVLRILVVFALVTPFWSLFDQKASTWVLTAEGMSKPSWFEASMMQALNPFLVMIIIPFNNLVLYPALRRRGIELSSLRRMTIGLFFAAASWVVIGSIQLVLDGGTVLSITWQILPYALLTFGEVLVSATGLEFAYSQAPAAMKGVIMSFWNLAVTIGNLWVLLANTSVRSPSVIKGIASTGISTTAFLMFFFAGFALLAAIAFAFYARRYKMVDHYRAAAPTQTPPAEVRVVKDKTK